MSAATAELPAAAPATWAGELSAILARLAAIERKLGIADPDPDTAEITETYPAQACRVCGRLFYPRHPRELDCSRACRADSRRRRNRAWWRRRGRAGRVAGSAQPAAVSVAPAARKRKPPCYSCGQPSRELIERIDPESFALAMVPYCGRC